MTKSIVTGAAQNAITLMQQGSYGTTADVLKHSLYDTRYFNTTPSDASFFSQPIGSPWVVGNKTKNETNLAQASQVPAGHQFLVNRISVAIISNYNPLTVGATTGWKNPALLAASYVTIMQNSVFELKIAGRDFDTQIHGRMFLPSMSFNGYLSSGVGGLAFRNGDVITGGHVSLVEVPIVLDQNVTFNVNQSTSIANTTLYSAAVTNAYATLSDASCVLQLSLEGILVRSK